ncbi:cytochrome bd biosynthesis protein, partial [Vibrio cholerae]|nr:cytochrome bd biosynthesis protein [Vibrio cholerae]
MSDWQLKWSEKIARCHDITD